MNRVENAIAMMAANVKARIADGRTTQEAADKLNRDLDMSWEELASFQELKSAVCGTVLSVDEATTIYRHLGESPDVFNGRDVSVKVVLTLIFGELLGMKMSGKLSAVAVA